jgi:DNA modification methylase
MNNNILKTQLVKWEDLKLFQPSDLKKMSKSQLDKLKTSLKNNGFKTPFYVWEDKEILWCLDGHMRLPVLKLLRDEGEAIPEKLPANFVFCKNKKDAKKAVMIYNSHYADIKQDVFADWIKDLDFEDLKLEIDIDDIDFGKIEQMLQPETNNDDEVPEDVKPITKLGDLWELGRHRVLCGDSTKIEDVERLMDGKKANLYFTDPPYSVNYTKKAKEVLKSKEYSEIKNDNLSVKETSEIIWRPCFKNAYDVCSDDSSFYMTMPQGGDQMMMMMMMSEKWQVKHELIWVKDAPVFSMGRLDYDYMHEPIIYGWKKKRNFYKQGGYQKSVWQIKRTENKLHPTMKPVELIKNCILNSSMENCIIYDSFSGSGSSLIASEVTNRVCYGMELDEHYCDVIRDRYIKWCKDNNRPYSVKLNGEEWIK